MVRKLRSVCGDASMKNDGEKFVGRRGNAMTTSLANYACLQGQPCLAAVTQRGFKCVDTQEIDEQSREAVLCDMEVCCLLFLCISAALCSLGKSRQDSPSSYLSFRLGSGKLSLI